MARPPRQQRPLLLPHEAPAPGFSHDFAAPSKLARALSLERKACGNGGVAYLKQKQSEQFAYVAEARKRPLPPLEAVVAHQAVMSDLRRDAADVARLPPGGLEAPQNQELRLKKQASFFEMRKNRHDEANEDLERAFDRLADECQEGSSEAAKRMQQEVGEAEKRVDELLRPLEGNTDDLGERTEDEIRGILRALEDATQARRATIDDFSSELEAIDTGRRETSEGLLKTLAEKLTAAAHAVPGEIERVVETKTLHLNAVLLENQKARKTLHGKLTVQTLERSKVNKNRWHTGLLLWKTKRHRHTVEQVMARIRSSEFRQPAALEELMGRVREQQTEAYDGRMELASQLFKKSLKHLQVGTVRSWEEQNGTLNDQCGDAFDALFEEMKSFKERLEMSAERMVSSLMQELEIIGAKSEWGEHESVAELIKADVRPPLNVNLKIVSDLMAAVTDAVSNQEEVQHHDASQMLAFAMRVAKKHEDLTKRTTEFEVNYRGEVDDCVHENDELNAENERRMEKFREEIDEAVHHEDLDNLKQQAFDHLQTWEGQYRDHADTLLGIHSRYPGNVATFFEGMTDGFCKDLGLTVKVEPSEEQKEARAAAEAEAVAAEEAAAKANPKQKEVLQAAADEARAKADAFAAAMPDLPEWPAAAPSGCEVMERLELAQLREEILSAPPPAGADAPAEPAAEAAEAEAVEGEAPEGSEHSVEQPRFHDGTLVLQELHFGAEFLEERMSAARAVVFTHLGHVRRHLDAVDIAGACEEVRLELDQRLRRHTNRKGEVQVGWYMPRYAIVAKHKDKFERHLVDIARKSQGHDDQADGLYEEMDKSEEGYKTGLVDLQEKLGEAETLSHLTAMERKALDMAASFKEFCLQIKERLTHLATRAPQNLMKENKAFLAMCKGSDEGYSEAEVSFYAEEIEELNAQLEKRAQERSTKARELEEQLEGKRQVPLKEYMGQYAEAVENLCAAKGYGKKYGKPRRKAQGLTRTLIAHSATVKSNLGGLLECFRTLCASPIEEAGIEAGALPKNSLFRLKTHFDKAGEPWVFTGEVIGTLYIIVCTVASLGSHLKAFKPERAALLEAKAVPTIRVLREAEQLVSEETEEAGKAAEAELREACLGRVMGALMQTDTFEVEVEAIVKDAQKESHETYKGTIPNFMQTFLEEMQESAKKARTEASRDLREAANLLREEALPMLGDAIFGELTARATFELRRGTNEATAETVAAWAESDALRAKHEKSLSPGLANPNAEAQLQELVEAEAARTERALEMCAADRAKMAEVLRGLGDGFVQRVAASFEAAIRLVDALPLHSFFAPLPGDEQAENPRMSIKRRMRHLQRGTSVDQWGDGLPERAWAGPPRYELRGELRGGAWPPDPELAEATEESLLAPMPAIASFRSPVHKRLLERRTFYYERYKAAFLEEARRRDAELAARLTKETVGKRNWRSNVRQLQGESHAQEEDQEE